MSTNPSKFLQWRLRQSQKKTVKLSKKLINSQHYAVPGMKELDLLKLVLQVRPKR